jgi:hypothetical protein
MSIRCNEKGKKICTPSGIRQSKIPNQGAFQPNRRHNNNPLIITISNGRHNPLIANTYSPQDANLPIHLTLASP